ncbi:hypothetical protein BH09MYX1_BH09MYX1_48610 [soil metagenome]
MRAASFFALVALVGCSSHGGVVQDPAASGSPLSSAPIAQATTAAMPGPDLSDLAPAIPPELLSPALRNASLRSPMPGGSIGGWYGDTGVDISGRYLAVYAIGDGTLDYSERGHTRWTGPGDTAFSVRLKLEPPISWKGRKVTHVYYTHLSAVVTNQPEAASAKKRVVAGEPIATSGIGNGVPHLHLGLLLDDEVEQDSWEFILREDAVRAVMGGYKNGETLPVRK